MEDCKKPLVSIGIPLYNAYPYIGEMLDSILAQTYDNWELWVVDDGSKDQGGVCVIEYALKDSRIKYLKRSADRAKGACSCRNIAFENARGKYMIWLDADDLIAPYCLKQRVTFMEENPELDFSVFPALPFKKRPLDSNDYYFGYKSEERALNNLLNRRLPFTVVTNIYKRDVLNEKKISWDENLMSLQDSDFNMTCILSGLIFRESGIVDYHIRNVSNSIKNSIYSDSHTLSHIYFFEKYTTLFEKKPEYKRDLILLSRYLLRLIGNNTANYRNRFFDLSFWKKRILLTKKIKLLTLSDKISHHKLNSLMYFILLPKTYLYKRRLDRAIISQNRPNIIELRNAAMADYDISKG